MKIEINLLGGDFAPDVILKEAALGIKHCQVKPK